MWQFMRGTARSYKMKMNYLIDERRDPYLSTKAAGKLLKTNYKKLGLGSISLLLLIITEQEVLLRAIKN